MTLFSIFISARLLIRQFSLVSSGINWQLENNWEKFNGFSDSTSSSNILYGLATLTSKRIAHRDPEDLRS